jgi:hypothetical protein
MRSKSNLKLVDTDNEQRESWKLTRVEIASRVRNVRLELETFRTRLEVMPFDVVTDDTRGLSITSTGRGR